MQLEAKKKYNVELTGEEISLIQNALIELPYKFSAQIINDLPNKISEVKDLANSEHVAPVDNIE